jgi:hypothetical protein
MSMNKPIVLPYLEPSSLDTPNTHAMRSFYRLLILIMFDVMRHVDAIAIIPAAHAVDSHGVFPLSQE